MYELFDKVEQLESRIPDYETQIRNLEEENRQLRMDVDKMK